MANFISTDFGNGNRQRISYGREAGDGYMYVFKHGIGPLTKPEDAGIIRVDSYDDGILFVWLDRVLRVEEHKTFDIPLETENSEWIKDHPLN